jgi:hypothetical protein
MAAHVVKFRMGPGGTYLDMLQISLILEPVTVPYHMEKRTIS